VLDAPKGRLLRRGRNRGAGHEMMTPANQRAVGGDLGLSPGFIGGLSAAMAGITSRMMSESAF
jgi:hypothetical protein